MDPRQVAVQHHYGVGAGAKLSHGLGSVISDICADALVGKALSDEVSQWTAILHDQHLHPGLKAANRRPRLVNGAGRTHSTPGAQSF